MKEELIQSILKGEPFEQVVDKAAKYLNNPLVIINNSYNIIAHSSCIKIDDLIWNNAVSRGYITLEFATTLNHWHTLKDKNRKYECMTVDQINERRRRFYKLEINHQLLGYLNITEVKHDFDDLDEECYYFVSQVLAKELLIQQKLMPPSDRLQNEDILLELRRDNYINRIHLYERVQFSHLKMTSTYRVLCSDLNDFLSYNADEDDFKHELLSHFPGSTIIVVDKILIILVEERAGLFNKELNDYLKFKQLILGISDVFYELFEFKRYENQAISAYENRKYLLDDFDRYVFYEQVKIYDLLRQIPREELLYFCHRTVLNIYEYDKKFETDYLNTLNVYLRMKQSIKATSNYLYLHRNTINYRILKIKELFHLDLDDYAVVNQLLFSCQIIQVWCK